MSRFRPYTPKRPEGRFKYVPGLAGFEAMVHAEPTRVGSNTENARDAAGLFDAGGEVVLIPRLDGKVMIFIGPSQVIAPPGPAGIEQRPDCDRGVYHGAPCEECDGAGWHVWKACPRCGGTAVWRYLDDRTRMRCRACGASWSLDYPGWSRSGSLSGCSRPASPRRHAEHKEGEAT